MSLNNSTSIVTNGLQFCYDMGNTQKSWKGPPVTNSVTNADTMLGWTAYYRTLATSTFITEFGTTGYRFINQPSWNGIYRSVTIPSTGTYTFSAWIRYLGGSTSNNGATVYIAGWGGGDSAVAINKSLVGEWQRISITLNCTVTSFTFYLISYGGTDNGTGNPDFSSWDVTMPQAEPGSYATPFVNGTRSATQAVIDLTGNKTVTASGLTYASNNTFSFNSGSLTLSSINFSAGQTIEIWLQPLENDAERRNPYNQAYGGYGTWTHEPSGNINYYYGDAGANANPYVGHGSSFTVVQNEIACVCTTRNTTESWWYKNGVQYNNYPHLYDTLTADANSILIGTGYAGAYVGNIFSVKLYDRALTSGEVLQNFNAVRGRFGI